MLKIDVLRHVVDQRLTAATDDIFRLFARTIAEYEDEVFRAKQEIDRQRRMLEATGRPEDTPAGCLQVRGRGLSLCVKQEEGGATAEPEQVEFKFTPSRDWQRERPEEELTAASNQIQSCTEEAEPGNTQEVLSVKQEVVEDHVMLEAAVRAEISCQQEGVLQIFTTEEEQQVSLRSLILNHLHVKQEEAAEPKESDAKFTPDWLKQSGSNDEGGSSSNQIQSHRGEELLPARDVAQSESSAEDADQQTPAQSEAGLQRMRGAGPPVCSSCGREFSSQRTLRKHIRRSSSQNQDQMSCSRRRPNAPFVSPAKSFNCRICRTSFYMQGILVRHAESHCREPESRCGACGDHLDSTERLRDHLRSHKELGSTCDICGRKCSSIRRMEIHRRVHTGEKPYRCALCSRDFSRKENLERHLRVHSGEKPHQCGICRSTFTRRSYLIQHLKNGHPERPGPEPAAR
ncbi:hypothetical protein PAMP_008550 [Pampus punctatissimus]